MEELANLTPETIKAEMCVFSRSFTLEECSRANRRQICGQYPSRLSPRFRSLYASYPIATILASFSVYHNSWCLLPALLYYDHALTFSEYCPCACPD